MGARGASSSSSHIAMHCVVAAVPVNLAVSMTITIDINVSFRQSEITAPEMWDGRVGLLRPLSLLGPLRLVLVIVSEAIISNKISSVICLISITSITSIIHPAAEATILIHESDRPSCPEPRELRPHEDCSGEIQCILEI